MTTLGSRHTDARSATAAHAEIRMISKVYPDVTTAISDLTFTVRHGEFFSLLGPSGCGKSTLLRIIAGLETPTTGTVVVGGEDMAGRPAHRRPTNMLQGLALFPHMTVDQNVGFGPRLRPARTASLAERPQRQRPDDRRHPRRAPYERIPADT